MQMIESEVLRQHRSELLREAEKEFCSLVLFSAGALGERVAAKPKAELETRR